jgi:large conductance mechanosensitive channel
MGMVRGYRDFIMRGNVIDLAVAVVIGTAFNDVVKAFTNSFLQPLIKLVSGGHQFSGQWKVPGTTVAFAWGDFLNAVITFLLISAAVYFIVVLPMNKLHERIARGEEPEPKAPSQEVVLLTEIRDALVNGGHPGGQAESAISRVRQAAAGNAPDRAARPD